MKKKLFILACILIFITLVFIFLNKAPKININETNSSSLSSDISNDSFELNYKSLTLCIGEKIGFVPSKEGDFTYESSASYIAKMQNNILLGVNLGSAVIKDRQIMANDGILVVIANVDMKKRELLIKPNITTRGFILVNENEELIHKIETKAETTIKTSLQDPKTTFANLKTEITEVLYPFIYNLTGRKPIILPIILDIKRDK